MAGSLLEGDDTSRVTHRAQALGHGRTGPEKVVQILVGPEPDCVPPMLAGVTELHDDTLVHPAVFGR